MYIIVTFSLQIVNMKFLSEELRLRLRLLTAFYIYTVKPVTRKPETLCP